MNGFPLLSFTTFSDECLGSNKRLLPRGRQKASERRPAYCELGFGGRTDRARSWPWQGKPNRDTEAGWEGICTNTQSGKQRGGAQCHASQATVDPAGTQES